MSNVSNNTKMFFISLVLNGHLKQEVIEIASVFSVRDSTGYDGPSEFFHSLVLSKNTPTTLVQEITGITPISLSRTGRSKDVAKERLIAHIKANTNDLNDSYLFCYWGKSTYKDLANFMGKDMKTYFPVSKRFNVQKYVVQLFYQFECYENVQMYGQLSLQNIIRILLNSILGSSEADILYIEKNRETRAMSGTFMLRMLCTTLIKINHLGGFGLFEFEGRIKNSTKTNLEIDDKGY